MEEMTRIISTDNKSIIILYVSCICYMHYGIMHKKTIILCICNKSNSQYLTAKFHIHFEQGNKTEEQMQKKGPTKCGIGQTPLACVSSGVFPKQYGYTKHARKMD